MDHPTNGPTRQQIEAEIEKAYRWKPADEWMTYAADAVLSLLESHRPDNDPVNVTHLTPDQIAEAGAMLAAADHIEPVHIPTPGNDHPEQP